MLPEPLPRSSPGTADVEPLLLSRHRALMSEYMRSTAIFRDGSLSGKMATYHMGWTDRAGRATANGLGKLVRPSLCLWACSALGGEVETALPAAAALEWIHNFTLVHDDIQDGDRERRGRETVWSIWGVGQGINVGDAIFALAFTHLASESADPVRTLQALRVLGAATLEVIEGQCLDLNLEGQTGATVRAYLRMVRAKTGALLGASLEAGAIMAGSAQGVAGAFRHAGRLLGTAFQMRDDWLGMWGDPSLTGKSRTADANRHKMSYPVVAAYAVMSPLQRTRLHELFHSETAEAEPKLRELLEQVGAADLTQEAPRRFAGKAVATLARTGLSRESLEAFEAVAHYVSTRAR
ncbi:MAG: polyprenyl synthetase family protein [Vulcanimicrobiaceae bacterium]